MKTKRFYWHVHHDKLCEWCYDYQERVDYIKENKPEKEIETRLRLMKPVKGKLPEEFVEACKKWDKTYKKWDEAYKKYVETYKKWDEACKKWDEAYKKWDETYKKYVEAYKKWIEAYEKYDKAYKKCVEAYPKYLPKLEELHKKECGCKEWNGKEIIFK